MFKILQTLSYTVHSIFLPKFSTFVLFTLILNMPAIILQVLQLGKLHTTHGHNQDKDAD